MTRFTIVLVSSLAVVAACSKKKEEAGGAAAKATEGKAGAFKIEKLKLQVDVPDGTSAGDAIVGDGVMLQGPGLGAMQVEIPKTPQSLDEAKSDASMYTPTNLKTETLPDGWVLTFENTGSMGKNFFVNVRRDIGGKTYMCTTTCGEADQAKAVTAACKTLRP